MYRLGFIIVIIFISGSIATAQKQGQMLIDSLTKVLITQEDDTNKVETLSNLSFRMFRTDTKKGVDYGLRGLSLAKKLKWKQGIAQNCNSLGVNYMVQGKYKNALDFYQKSMTINEELGNNQRVAATLGNIGIIHYNQGRYDKALVYYERALKVQKESNNKKSIASVLNNIGNIYEAQSKNDAALENYFKALSINKELSNQNGIALNYGAIANLFFRQKEYDGAIKYYRKSIKINKKQGDKRQTVYNLINLSDLYQILGKGQDSLSDTLSEIPDVSKCFTLAIRYALEAESLADDMELGEKQFGIYLTLSSAYEKLGNKALALKYHKLYFIAYESIMSSENQGKITKLEIKFDEEKARQKAKEISRKKEQEIAHRNILQYSGMSILVIVLFACLFFIPKFNISNGLIEGLTFITFLLFYEFILVFIEPYVDKFTMNIPFYKLSINLSIALLFIPFHKIEKKIRMRYISRHL